jgi:hypothetical protein
MATLTSGAWVMQMAAFRGQGSTPPPAPTVSSMLKHGGGGSQFDLQVRREVQPLLARKLLAHYNFTVQVEPNQTD